MITLYKYITIGLALLINSIAAIGCIDNLSNSNDIDIVGMGNNDTQKSNEFGENRVDYDSYINKVWVIKDEDIYNGFSFVIKKIRGGLIEGSFRRDCLVIPYVYSGNWLFDTGDKMGYFRGGIINNVANCKFIDSEGSGDIALVFKDNEEIEVSIKEYSDETKEYIIGHYFFRPYNTSDWIEDEFEGTNLNEYEKITSKNKKYEMDLDKWGKVNILTGVEVGKGDRAPDYISYAILTDTQNNILYNFYSTSNIMNEIVDVKIEDTNRDGLKDIVFTYNYIQTNTNDYYNDSIESIIIQMDNGWFYDRNLLNIDTWTGEYEFKEYDELNINISYNINIYKEENQYFAKISINKRILSSDKLPERSIIKAKVVADETKAEFIFEEYLPDNEVESESFKQGDVLLTFEKRYVYELLTEWGALKPVLPENQESDKSYFKKND